MATWLADEAFGKPTEKTQGLLERVRAQSGGLDEALVAFWAQHVVQRAVKIEGFEPAVRLMLVDLTHEFCRKVCSTLQAGRKIPCCVVRGASRIGIVLGVAEPPEHLDEWIMVHVENRNPSECV